MIPAYLLLLLPGDVLGIAGAGSVAPVGVDGQVCFVFSMRPSVSGTFAARGSVDASVSMRGAVGGVLTIAEC